MPDMVSCRSKFPGHVTCFPFAEWSEIVSASRGDRMKSLLPAAFVFLLWAVWASEIPATSGFYLNQEPITVAKACSIMLNPDNFQTLPHLFVVAPLSVKDTALFVQAIAPYSHAINNAKLAIWHAWVNALQLPEEHPTVQHCKTLYSYLAGAVLVIRRPHLGNVKLGPCRAGPSYAEADVQLECDAPSEPPIALMIRRLYLEVLAEHLC